MPKITSKYGKEAFEFRDNSIVVTIPFNWINVMSDQMGNKNDKKTKPLNKTQSSILDIIRDNPNISKSQIAEKIGKGKTTVDKGIAFLRDNGYIEHEGSRKFGYWKILNKE